MKKRTKQSKNEKKRKKYNQRKKGHIIEAKAKSFRKAKERKKPSH